MSHSLRLFEDQLPGGSMHRLAPANRAVYVAAGAAEICGQGFGADEGGVFTTACPVHVGKEGATLWRWEAMPAHAASPRPEGRDVRGSLRLEARFDAAAVDGALLLRLDSVAFPPGGAAFRHVHQGPGIRCLLCGSIRIDTEGRSLSYGPGGAWFESGPEPVFAQAAADRETRFIRAMVLPRRLAGQSSIRYVDDADRDKPKSQRYRGYGEAEIELD